MCFVLYFSTLAAPNALNIIILVASMLGSILSGLKAVFPMFQKLAPEGEGIMKDEVSAEYGPGLSEKSTTTTVAQLEATVAQLQSYVQSRLFQQYSLFMQHHDRLQALDGSNVPYPPMQSPRNNNDYSLDKQKTLMRLASHSTDQTHAAFSDIELPPASPRSPKNNKLHIRLLATPKSPALYSPKSATNIPPLSLGDVALTLPSVIVPPKKP